MSATRIIPKLKFARQDPDLCFAPVFRGLHRDAEKRAVNWLKVTYRNGKDALEFEGPALGPEDLRVLQGLIALAGLEGTELAIDNPASEDTTRLRDGFGLKDVSGGGLSLMVRVGFTRLATEIGYRNPTAHSAALQIRASIEQLWKLSIIERRGDQSYPCKLLSYLWSDVGKKKEACVALNPRITSVILGLRPHHVRIDMAEVRALRSGPARILHQKLSALVDHGARRALKIETLCGYVWPNSATTNAMRKRRFVVRKALDELVATGGWTVCSKDERPSVLVIGRKALQVIPKTAHKASSAPDEALAEAA